MCMGICIQKESHLTKLGRPISQEMRRIGEQRGKRHGMDSDGMVEGGKSRQPAHGDPPESMRIKTPIGIGNRAIA